MVLLKRMLTIALIAGQLFMPSSYAGTSASIAIKVTVTQPMYSVVTTDGYRLMVQKRLAGGTLAAAEPYIMKGVCWSPASEDTVNTYASRSIEFAKWINIDAPLIKEMNANTIRTYTDIGQDDAALMMLDTLYQNGIMVVMSIDNWAADDNAYKAYALQTVEKYKNHPAILMWLVGNEWNVNCYYTVDPAVRKPTPAEILAAAQRTQDIAASIKLADPNHLISTCYGNPDDPDLATIRNFAQNVCTAVDVWGFNVYKGLTFGTTFSDWPAVSTKPMFISESGCDSYDYYVGVEDEQAQADFEAMQWEYVVCNLSAKDQSKVCIGALFFEWNDEWWKAKPAEAQNPGGWSGPFPDGVGDEDYWGVTKITRDAKQAYYKLREMFDPNYKATSFTLKASSSAGSSYDVAKFSRNGACFYYGKNPPNRGINIVVLNPTNDVSSYIYDIKSFDTWRGDSDAMAAYLNGVPDGKILMFAIVDEGTRYLSETEKQALELLGSSHIRQVNYHESWAMIVEKGTGYAYAEDYGPGVKTASATFQID